MCSNTQRNCAVVQPEILGPKKGSYVRVCHLPFVYLTPKSGKSSLLELDTRYRGYVTTRPGPLSTVQVY